MSMAFQEQDAEPGGAEQPVTGYSIDRAGTKIIDDAVNIVPYSDGWMVEICVADVPSHVPAGCRMDMDAAMMGGDQKINGTLYRMFPEVFARDTMSLAQGRTRPAISFLVDVGKDGAVRDFAVGRQNFKNKGALSFDDFNDLTAHKAPQFRDHGKVALLLNRQRQQELSAQFAPNMSPSMVRRVQRGKAPFLYNDNLGDFVVQEMMALASKVGTMYMRRHGLPFVESHYDVSIMQKNKSCMDEFNARSLCICDKVGKALRSDFSLHAKVTSPIRRYEDLVNLRVIAAHMEGKSLPYTALTAAQIKAHQDNVMACIQDGILNGTRNVAEFFAGMAKTGFDNFTASLARMAEGAGRDVVNLYDAGTGNKKYPRVTSSHGEPILRTAPDSKLFDDLKGQLSRAGWRPAEFTVHRVSQAGAAIHYAAIRAVSRDGRQKYDITATGESGGEAFDRATGTLMERLGAQLPRQFSGPKL